MEKCLVYNKHIVADMVITVVIVVAASVIITIFGERNFFLSWCRAATSPV